MSKPHYDALEALIPTEHFTVFRGSAPNKPDAEDYPYVVLGGNAGTESTEAAAGPPDSLDLRFKLTYAALSFDSVLFVINEVRSAVLGKRLQVPGWTCTPFLHEALLDIRTDYDVSIPDIGSPLFAVDELTVFSGR